MTDRNEVELGRRSAQLLSLAAQRDVAKLFAKLNPLNRLATRDTLLEFLPDIVETYGEAAAAASADYYETLRSSSGIPGVYTPRLAGAAPRAQIEASTRWAVGGLFVPDDAVNPQAVLGNLHKVTDRLVKLPGRETFAGALEGDPSNPRYARIPTGAVTCRFCATLASRGAVYLTEESAGGLREWHDHCDCIAVAIFEGEALPAGYNPEHYLKEYSELGGASQDFRKGNKTFRSPEVNTAKGAPPSRRGSVTNPAAPPPAGFDAFPRHTPGTLLDEADEANPFFGTEEAYGVNCQMCTTTTEMRARGFDVEAMPNYDDGAVPYLGNREIPRRWLNKDGSRADWDATPKSMKELVDVVNSWPEGARGAVSVVWKGGRGGHIFNAEKVGGKVQFVDAQPARTRLTSRRKNFTDTVSWKRQNSPGVSVMRLDNRTPDASLAGQMRARGSFKGGERVLAQKARDAQRVVIRETRPLYEAARAKRDEWVALVPKNATESAARRRAISNLATDMAFLRAKMGL